jgi:hypothetical protein
MTIETRTPPLARIPGQNARARRDIVSGETMDEDRLVRFVLGPDQIIVPDVGRKLPGRGLWVAADRRSVDLAARKGLFARAAKTRLAAPPDLADQTANLIFLRLLSALGLARKAGALTFGFAKVLAATRAGRVSHLIEAVDGSAEGRRKLIAAGARNARPPRLIGLFTAGELGLALGGENVIHTALLAGLASDRWTIEVERLSGFRPLFPEGWREEPRG